MRNFMFILCYCLKFIYLLSKYYDLCNLRLLNADFYG